jgi:hypothetical protein
VNLHFGQYDHCGVARCGVVGAARYIQTFWKGLLPPSSGKNIEEISSFKNVNTYLHSCTSHKPEVLTGIILNSVAWVRERTIPTERPPLVSEVSDNFCEYKVPRNQRDGSLWPYSRYSRPKPLLFLQSSSSVLLTRLSAPPSRPTTSQKIFYHRESNPDLWICSQELWPLDHRGGLLSST